MGDRTILCWPKDILDEGVGGMHNFDDWLPDLSKAEKAFYTHHDYKDGSLVAFMVEDILGVFTLRVHSDHSHEWIGQHPCGATLFYEPGTENIGSIEDLIEYWRLDADDFPEHGDHTDHEVQARWDWPNEPVFRLVCGETDGKWRLDPVEHTEFPPLPSSELPLADKAH